MDNYRLRKVGKELFGRWGWQTRMAEELGVNISTVKRWLAGTTPIPTPVRLALHYLLLKKKHPNLEIENEVECENL